MSGLGLPHQIALDSEQAHSDARDFVATQIGEIFTLYPWLNNEANTAKQVSEANGLGESVYIPKVCGLAIGGVILNNQRVDLGARQEEITAASAVLKTSLEHRDGVVISPDHTRFGAEIRSRSAAYADAIESVADRFMGDPDQFIVGATMTFLVADAIHHRNF